ncbi:MAG: P-loop NTPase [Spirochaetales bacterium]|nr:P-loop NTPase [Spirochaetales bacterium]
MIDPRFSVVERRLKDVNRILVVSSGKGGVGKSVFSSSAALALKMLGYKTGLLDLDFQGSSDHIILGEGVSFPEESGGIRPFKLSSGIAFISFSLFTGESALPLRGVDTTNAILELLAITVWGELDFLIIDLPPGIGEEVLDIIRLIKRLEFILISSSSLISVKVVKRLAAILKNINVCIEGVVENMASDSSNYVTDMAHEYGLNYLGSIPFVSQLESEIGNWKKLKDGVFAGCVSSVIKRIV